MTSDLLRPPALDRTGAVVPHRFWDVHHRAFFAQQVVQGTMTRDQVNTLCQDTSYRAHFDEKLRTTGLDLLQALTLIDVITLPVAKFGQSWWPRPGYTIALAVSAEALVPHHNDRWSTDFNLLAQLCQSWDPVQGFAVLGAISRFAAVHADCVTAAQLVGLAPPDPLPLAL